MKTARMLARSLFALVLATGAATGAAQAGDTKADKKGAPAAAAGKEVTLKGEMVCGKCALKESEKCGGVLKVTDAGKETKYYLADNATSEKAHAKICGGSAKATVKGTVAEDAGKKVLTASDVKYE